jgi:hypothetical protein
MTIYSDKLTFRLPRKEEVALTDELVSIIQNHYQKSREHLFHLCMIAYGLRKHNLTRVKAGAGGNAKGQVYKAEFRDWYQKNKLARVYGSEGNFTLYAMAGRLLEYVRWQVGAEYIAHLPRSMTALYEASQILWDQGHATDDHRRQLFHRALKEPISDGSEMNALIHPQVTRKEIKLWRERTAGAVSATNTVVSGGKCGSTSTNGGSSSDVSEPSQHTIPIVTIKAHKDLLNFARASGRKVRGPKIEDVERLFELLREVLEQLNDGTQRFILEGSLDRLKQAYEAAKNPDFGKNIRAREELRYGQDRSRI